MSEWIELSHRIHRHMLNARTSEEVNYWARHYNRLWNMIQRFRSPTVVQPRSGT